MSEDLFAILRETRRPWLDADALKEKFHRLTANHHPDVAAQNFESSPRDFAEINRAYQTLADLPARLRHLLALEFPEINTRQLPISDELSALFLAISESQQTLVAFLAKQAQASSPLAKALLAPEQFELLETTQQLAARVANRQLEVERGVRELDAHWENAQSEKSTFGTELAALYQSSAFLAKWSTQLREVMMKLHG